MVFLTENMRFPPVETATAEGVLAVGGDLSVKRLIEAYSEGIFPWFDHGSLIMWWSPDPRMVLLPSEVKVSKSMRKILHRQVFRVTYNTAFDKVIKHCATTSRKGQDDTWITPEMIHAYTDLLVGGLYGLDLGHVFCGESMFSLMSNASKVALVTLARNLEEQKYRLIDCQMYTDHLASMGTREIPRKDFIKILKSSTTGLEPLYI